MLVLTIFGCAALLLAAIGIAGLMAYSAAQRAQEIGIRLALGAEPPSFRNLIVFQGLRLVALGVVIGLAAAFGLRNLIASLLFPIVLLGVALLPVWLPAMLGSRVDPIEALRYE